MRRIALWLLLGALGCKQRLPGPQLAIRAAGKPAAQFQLRQLTRMVTPTRLTIHDPHELRSLEYEALPLAQLLAALPAAHQEGNDLFFRCADGYEATVSRDTWQKHAKHAYLAFRLPRRDTFRVTDAKKNGKPIDLGPYYLIWNNQREPALRRGIGADAPSRLLGPGVDPPRASGCALL